jgi:Na+-driven multidrug efflux pump
MNVWPVWGLELFTASAGYITPNTTTALAAQSILRALSLLVFMFPFGIRMATNVTVGKNVGSKRAEGCRHYYRTGLTIVFIYAGIMTTLMRLFSGWFMRIFTDNLETIAEMESTWVLFTFFVWID